MQGFKKMIPFFPMFGRDCIPCLEYYTILYMMLVVIQMMLDATLFQGIIGVSSGSESSPDVYQCIIIPVHCLQATLQFFFGFDLHKAVIRRSYRRAQNWRTIFFCFLAVELSILVAYGALASFLSLFTYVSVGFLIFKLYLIWPLRLFLEECRDTCVPLARASSPLLLSDNMDAANAARPGPSRNISHKIPV